MLLVPTYITSSNTRTFFLFNCQYNCNIWYNPDLNLSRTVWGYSIYLLSVLSQALPPPPQAYFIYVIFLIWHIQLPTLSWPPKTIKDMEIHWLYTWWETVGMFHVISFPLRSSSRFPYKHVYLLSFSKVCPVINIVF